MILCSCSKKEESNAEADLRPISFNFVLLDELGRNIFFGEEAYSNPDSVIFCIGQDTTEIPQYWFNIKDSSYFQLYDFYGKKDAYVFHFKFVQDKIDTIQIAPSKIQKSDNELYPYDTFFNQELICTDCSYSQIHEIIID